MRPRGLTFSRGALRTKSDQCLGLANERTSERGKRVAGIASERVGACERTASKVNTNIISAKTTGSAPESRATCGSVTDRCEGII